MISTCPEREEASYSQTATTLKVSISDTEICFFRSFSHPSTFFSKWLNFVSYSNFELDTTVSRIPETDRDV